MSGIINTSNVSYSYLESLGWPQSLIDDYQSIKNVLRPQHGQEADPNGIYRANLNGFYVDTVNQVIWFNPSPGEMTGWIAT